MPKRLLTDKHVSFVEDGVEVVRQENVSNYRTTIKENLNEGVPQIFRLLPQLLPYLDAGEFQQEIDGAEVGLALGKLLTPTQRRNLTAMLIWGEQGPDESDEEFLKRVPDLADEFKNRVNQAIERFQRSTEIIGFLRILSERLQDRLERQIEQRRAAQEVAMAVPVGRVIEWAISQQQSGGPPRVPDLLAELYGPWDGTPGDKLRACRNILLSLGMRRDVDTVRDGNVESLEDQWKFHLPPMESDIEQYLAVLDAVEADLQELVESYFETRNIVRADRLLKRAFDELKGLSRPGKDLLQWDTLRKVESTWKGNHTRTANTWTEDRDVPLLSVSKEEDDRREWEWTSFGELVKQLWERDITRDHVESKGLPADFDDDLLQAAITAADR